MLTPGLDSACFAKYLQNGRLAVVYDLELASPVDGFGVPKVGVLETVARVRTGVGLHGLFHGVQRHGDAVVAMRDSGDLPARFVGLQAKLVGHFGRHAKAAAELAL